MNKINNLSSQLKKFFESADDCTKIREYYPVIHYFFLQQEINKLYYLGWSQIDIGEYIRTGMDRSEVCLKTYKRIAKEVKKYLRILDIHTLIKVCYTTKYYCEGNKLFFKAVKKLLTIWRKLK